jgi:hypothetical protein
MTSFARLILSWMVKEAIGPSNITPPVQNNAMSSTMTRGLSNWPKAMNWNNTGLFGQSVNQPVGPAAIGAPKSIPGGLTDKARPGAAKV